MNKVSVIIPIYNVEPYIADTILSVLNQTYPQFELLLIDDGSSDRSLEICRQFTDPRIRIIQQKNSGPSAARNRGIREAQGDYLAFLDGDDRWAPEKLAKHVAHLNNNPAVGVSFSRSAFIDQTGALTSYYQMPPLHSITPDMILCRNPIGNGSTPVIRREVLDAIQFERDGSGIGCYFDESLHRSEDIECWVRIATQTPWQFEGLPEALTFYRINTNGLSANIFRQLEDWEAVITKTHTYAPDLVDRYAPIARAYQLRYLARRAISLQQGKTAMQLMHRALKSHWKILLYEPRRTLLTLAALYSFCVLPHQLYHPLEVIMMKLTGAAQKRKISRDTSLMA